VRKTSLYLTDELAARLKRLAEAEGKSQADILREAIERYPEPEVRRKILCYKIAPGPGDSVADIPEDELLARYGFGEDGLGAT